MCFFLTFKDRYYGYNITPFIITRAYSLSQTLKFTNIFNF